MLGNLKLFNTLTSLSRRIYSESLNPKRQCLIRHLVVMSYQRQHKLEPHKGERRSTERQTDDTGRHVLCRTSVGIAAEWVTRHTTTNGDGAGQGTRYVGPRRHFAGRLHATLD